MGNELDEVTGPVNRAGRGINVIEKQIPVTIGVGSLIFEIALWVAVPAIALAGVALGLVPMQQGVVVAALGVLPGLIFLFMTVNRRLKGTPYRRAIGTPLWGSGWQ